MGEKDIGILGGTFNPIHNAHLRVAEYVCSKYNFDKITNRKNTSSYKWDTSSSNNILPMWVADMDFEVLPEIKQSIINRANIGSYGYTFIPEEFYESFRLWWKKHHDTEIEREWMIYSNGVIATISSIVRRITKEDDNVLMLTPIYNTFYNSILNNKRNVVSCDLIYKDGGFAIDFEQLEALLKDEKTSMMIFCNPHNPIGKIWAKEDIKRVSFLAKKYNVKLLCDEVHCDIAKPGVKYNPILSTASELDNIICCLSAAKTFNISGLQTACVIVPNEELRKYINRGLNNDEVAEPNFFSMDAVIAAFKYGDDYVKELNAYIQKNKEYVYDFFKTNLPDIKTIYGEATYLMWIDFSYMTKNTAKFVKDLETNTGLKLCEGIKYGQAGEGFVRMNVATSFANVKDACKRIKMFVSKGDRPYE